jgi:hypothetical protein
MEDFGDEFGILIAAYEQDLYDELEQDVKAAGRIALKEVKVPPSGAGKYHDWDEYSSGWHSKWENRYNLYTIRIRNTKKPGLTHLLERGHIVHTKDDSDGKRYSKRFPHIARAAEIASKELTSRVREKGGRLK